MSSNFVKAASIVTSVLYPVDKGQPRRSPTTTVLSLIGNGYLWYYAVLILLGAAVLGAAVGLAFGNWVLSISK